MPVVTVENRITRPEHLVEYLSLLVEDSSLPFAYIAKYDETLIPEYPACQIQPGTMDKDVHGTHTFMIGLRAFLYVMHAKMTVGHQVRSLEDLQLATDLVALLEQDLTFGGRVISGWVDSETPATFPPRASKGDIVVGTRLTWNGLQEVRFK
jgi:hypothetical protein